MKSSIQLGERVRYRIGGGSSVGTVVNRFVREFGPGAELTMLTLRTLNGYCINRPMLSVERVQEQTPPARPDGGEE